MNSSAQRSGTIASGTVRGLSLLRLSQVAFAVLILLCARTLKAQSPDAISREVSVFNFGSIPTGVEAVSREVSVFNYGAVSKGFEVVSREVSVFIHGALALAVGSTNVFGDASNQVPLRLLTMLDLTNLSLTLFTDDSHLQVLSVTPASPEVVKVTLGPPADNGHPISFTLNPAAIPPTNHTLAYLNFRGITNLGSACVPLTKPRNAPIVR